MATLRIGCKVVGLILFATAFYYGFYMTDFPQAAYYMGFAIYVDMGTNL